MTLREALEAESAARGALKRARAVRTTEWRDEFTEEHPDWLWNEHHWQDRYTLDPDLQALTHEYERARIDLMVALKDNDLSEACAYLVGPTASGWWG